MKNIIFFNHFNNGDIHISRGFVRYIIEKVSNAYPKTIFKYTHRNKSLLQDIPNLIEDHSIIENLDNYYADIIEDDQNLYINTWYAAGNHKYMNTYGISFDTVFDVFENICTKYFNFSLNEVHPHDLFPVIDYTKFSIKKVKTFIDTATRPLVLVANGFAKSGQAANFSLGNSIVPLADRYHGITFLLTDDEQGNIPTRNNIIYTKNIIHKKNGSDLNENSYLSTKCDMIIGRSSGVHTFSLVQENLFNRNINILSFSNLSYKPNCFWLNDKFKDKVKYSSNIVNSTVENVTDATSVIDIYIKDMLSKL